MLIVGLGNPGKKFENTRHNIGFSVIDQFAKKNNFPAFKLDKKSNALISERGEVLLAKPQTFMNESGKAARVLNSKYKASSIIVVHDDIDLPLGKIKIVKSRGSAGHKGVESIIKELGSEDFIRVRIGILPETGKPENPEKFVLKKFGAKEKEILESVINKAVSALETVIKDGDGLEKVMNEYNR